MISRTLVHEWRLHNRKPKSCVDGPCRATRVGTCASRTIFTRYGDPAYVAAARRTAIDLSSRCPAPSTADQTFQWPGRVPACRDTAMFSRSGFSAAPRTARAHRRERRLEAAGEAAMEAGPDLSHHAGLALPLHPLARD